MVLPSHMSGKEKREKMVSARLPLNNAIIGLIRMTPAEPSLLSVTVNAPLIIQFIAKLIFVCLICMFCLSLSVHHGDRHLERPFTS